jgi:predicted Zn-dependent peptidase
MLARDATAMVLDPRAVHSDTLRNGLRVIVCEDPGASVASVAVVVRVGSADDPADQLGIAHLLEHVVWTQGGEDDPRLRIEQVGGIASAGTLRDFTRYHAVVETAHFELAIRALGELVLRDEFGESVLAREQRVVVEEGMAIRENARAVLNDLAFESLYGDEHPYGHRIDGERDTLWSIDVARLGLFHNTWYVPNNTAVIVAGGVSFERARAGAEAIFGHLLPAALPPRSWADLAGPAEPAGRVVHTRSTDACVMAVFLGPAASDPSDVCASDLIATLLAHGPLGRLNQALKERQRLAHEVGVEFLTQRDRALFGIWAVCDPESLAAVQSAILTEVRRLSAESVPGPEFAAAKGLLLAGYAFANETPADRASTLSFYEAIGSYRAASYYAPRVRALSQADLMRVSAQYLGEPVWVVVRPEPDEP